MPDTTDVMIWRYMDLARYVLLLERGLFFARASAFCDRWEGSIGEVDLTKFRENRVHLSPGELRREWEGYFKEKKRGLESVGVNCWHEASYESAALWEIYVSRGLGVAVASSKESLRKAIAATGRSLDVVQVEYSSYEDLETGAEPRKLLAHKRREFMHEREVRFVLDFSDDEKLAMKALKSSVKPRRRFFLPGKRGGALIIPPWGYASMDPTIQTRAAPDGVHLRTDLHILIKCVSLAPNVSYPTRRAVAAVTKAFGLDTRVIKESSVDQIPFDRVEFVDRE